MRALVHDGLREASIHEVDDAAIGRRRRRRSDLTMNEPVAWVRSTEREAGWTNVVAHPAAA